MKAVMLSLRPQWCEKIFNGSKSIEVRKSRPSIPTPFKVYVYQTKHNGGKVIGSFVCDDVITDFRGEHSDDFAKYALLSLDEQKKYGGNKLLYGWHITEPTLFEKPRELSEFYRSLPEKVLENGEYDCRKEWDVLCIDAPEGGDYCEECPYGGRVQITRAPQSWVYCETIDEK